MILRCKEPFNIGNLTECVMMALVYVFKKKGTQLNITFRDDRTLEIGSNIDISAMELSEFSAGLIRMTNNVLSEWCIIQSSS